MKTFLPLLAAFAMFSPAQASPDCTTVDPTSRLAECHGLPDFAVQVNLETDDRNRAPASAPSDYKPERRSEPKPDDKDSV